jgi:hypothetical protein
VTFGAILFQDWLHLVLEADVLPTTLRATASQRGDGDDGKQGRPHSLHHRQAPATSVEDDEIVY